MRISFTHLISYSHTFFHPYKFFEAASTIAIFTHTYFHYDSIRALKFIFLYQIVNSIIYDFVLLPLKKIIASKQKSSKPNGKSFIQDQMILAFFYQGVGQALFKLTHIEIFDFIGVALPLYMFFVRIGCFLSGCCYGKKNKFGVVYPAHIFKPWRAAFKYTPHPVLPTQLVESMLNLIIFIIISKNGGYIDPLPFYCLAYGILRLVIDFFREVSIRPRYLNGLISEGQLFSAILILIGLTYYFEFLLKIEILIFALEVAKCIKLYANRSFPGPFRCLLSEIDSARTG